MLFPWYSLVISLDSCSRAPVKRNLLNGHPIRWPVIKVPMRAFLSLLSEQPPLSCHYPFSRGLNSKQNFLFSYTVCFVSQIDFHLRCDEWDQSFSSGQWEPEVIVRKLPEFLQFVKEVQGLVREMQRNGPLKGKIKKNI